MECTCVRADRVIRAAYSGGILLLGSSTGLCAGAVYFSAGGCDCFFRDGMLRSGSDSDAAAMSRQMQYVTVLTVITCSQIKIICFIILSRPR